MNNNTGCSRCNQNNNCNTCETNNCIAEILQVINVLQSNACPDNCLNSCDRPALGGGTNCVVCNTDQLCFTCVEVTEHLCQCQLLELIQYVQTLLVKTVPMYLE